MAKAKDEARRMLVEIFTECLPLVLTEHQKAQLAEKVYDLVSELDNMVAEEYHVVAKFGGQ